MAVEGEDKQCHHKTSSSMELRGRCSRAQQQLDDAMASLVKTEKQLKEKASEVRSQVNSAMSRQQEALRCRELWLLGQVEILEQLKSETLQQQLINMNTLRAQINLISEQLNQPISMELRNHLSSQLIPLLNSLSNMSLTPDDSPDLCFYGDSRSLRSAITSFGTVTSSTPGPAPKRHKRESTLDQWLLGAEPQPVSESNQGSEFCDWLATNSQPQTYVPPLVNFDLFASWGQLCDLEAWLVKEAAPLQSTGLVPDNRSRSFSLSTSSSFEEIDHSELSSEEMDQSEEEQSFGEVLKPFSKVWEKSEWLLPRCGSCQGAKDQGVEIENLGLTLGRLRCLKTPAGGRGQDRATPTGTKSAAGGRGQDQATPTRATSPAAECSQDQTTPTEAKSPEGGRGQDLSTPTAVTSPELSLDQSQMTRAEMLEAWLQQVAPVSQVCKANEPCSSLRHCLCEDNCGGDALRHWLLQREGRDKNGRKTTPTNKKPTPTNEKDTPTEIATPTSEKATPTKKAPLSVSKREQKVQAIFEAWLHPTTSAPPSPVSMETFLRPLQVKQWVMQPQTNQSPELGPAHSSQPEDKWLLRKRSGTQEVAAVCDLFSCLKVNKNNEQWLHSATQM